MWCEGKTRYAGKWTGPYKLISTDGETCTIKLLNGPTPFRTTVVKPYHDDAANSSNDPGETVQEDSPKVDPPWRRLRPVVEIPPY